MPRPKGLPKTGGRQKGTLNKATLLKQERRAMFDAKVSQIWEETIDKLPPTYIADQFLGKAPQSLDVTTQGERITPREHLPPSQVSYLAAGVAELLRITKLEGVAAEEAMKRFREWHKTTFTPRE